MKKKRLIIVGSILLALMLALSGVIVLTTGAEEGEPSVRIAAQNVAFKDSVYLIYAVKADNVPAGAEKGMLFWLSPQETYSVDNAAIRLTESTPEQISMGGVNDTYDVYELNQLAARQMTDDVYAVAYIKDGDTVYYSAPVKYSILQYVHNIRKKGTADEKLLNLLNAMLDYGAAAQKYTGYKTDFLANAVTSQITVVDGTLDDGFTKGLYPSGTEITLTAPAEVDGKAFSYWKTGTGDVAGTAAVIVITVGSENETYTAVYGEAVPTDGPVPSEGLEFDSNGDDTCLVTGIGECTDTEIVIPSEHNGEKVIGIDSKAFAGESITAIHIPASVTEIGSKAFNGCTELTDVYYDGTEEDWKKIDVGGNNAPLENATMHFAGEEPAKTYTVKFVDYDGTVLETQTIKEGESATAPTNPTRSGYIFKGWDKIFVNVNEDLTVTATYTQSSTEPMITVSSANASAGDIDVEVTVALINNPGISSLILNVVYDPVLTLTDVIYNTSIGGQPVFPQSKSSPFKLYWVNGFANTTGDWTFATLKFAVSDRAAPGSYNISISYNADDVYDISETNINFSIINGSIIVE